MFFTLLTAAFLASSGFAATESEPEFKNSAQLAVSPLALPENNKQQILGEMRRRGLLSPRMDRWTPQDQELLDRIREAEAAGAFDILREEGGTLNSFAVEHKDESGKKLWLTKRGYFQYRFFKSQKARKYFEKEGRTEAKFIFMLRDMKGRRLFDPRGELTPSGHIIYDQILRGIEVEWRDSAGRKVATPR